MAMVEVARTGEAPVAGPAKLLSGTAVKGVSP